MAPKANHAGVAVLKLGARGPLLVVDFHCRGSVAHIAVNGIGKINRRGASRQGQNLTLGREYIDRIRKQINLDVIPKLRCITRLVLNIKQGLQPLGAHAVGRASRVLRLVEPVRGHAGLGHDVHFFGTNLKLDVQPRRPHHGGVQRLVAIELGDGNMILELAWHGLVHLVQHTQRGVAVGHRRHDDAKTV